MTQATITAVSTEVENSTPQVLDSPDVTSKPVPKKKTKKKQRKSKNKVVKGPKNLRPVGVVPKRTGGGFAGERQIQSSWLYVPPRLTCFTICSRNCFSTIHTRAQPQKGPKSEVITQNYSSTT